MAALTIPKGTEPFPIRTGMGDHITSLSAVSAILAAVVERGQTGVGRLVESSLLRSGVYAVGSDMAIQLRFGRVASNRPRREAVNPLNNFFQTKEGRWICLAVGKEELLEDERFSGARARRTHAGDLVTALDAAFAALSFEEAAARLDQADIAWSPVQRASEVAEDPQAEAAGCFVKTPDGKGGVFRAPAGPARFPGSVDGPRGPAPSLGQHTDEVLLGVGFTLEDVAALRQKGAAA